jgi:hypothetical protein
VTDLSPEAQKLLRQARAAFSPDEGRLAAVRAELKAQLGASLNAPPSAASSAGGAGLRALGAAGWSAGHTVIAAVAIGAMGAGALAMWPLTSRAPKPAPAELLTQPQPVSAPLAAPVAEQTAPSTLPSLALSPPPEEPAPALRTAARARAKSEAPPTVRAAPASTTDSLAEEVHMLRDARSALDRGDAAQALRLLDAHEARFRRGTLHEERLATRVQALCALGHADRARAVAQELQRAAPRSPHLARVRASCIAGPPTR